MLDFFEALHDEAAEGLAGRGVNIPASASPA